MIPKHYKSFIHQRDIYLEEYLRKSHLRISDFARSMFEDIKSITAHIYAEALAKQFTRYSTDLLEHLYWRIDQSIDHFNVQAAKELDKLSSLSYHLSYASQFEAVNRVMNKRDIMGRVEYVSNYEKYYSIYKASLMRLSAQIKQKIQSYYHQGKTDVVAAIDSITPDTRRITRELIKLRESKKTDSLEIKTPDQVSITQDMWDETMWDLLIDEYKDEYISPYRNKKDSEGRFYKIDDKYSWEIEQHTTENFLKSVKDGDNAAANAAGISDFLWLAVMDDRTREEHRKRHGLTSSEIQAKLEDEWSEDDDQGIVAPSGFNCLTAGHNIQTDQGKKKIEEIDIGDNVLTHNNRFMPVTRFLKRKESKFIKITLENGETLIGTLEHPVLTDRGWIELRNIKPIDKIIVYRGVD